MENLVNERLIMSTTEKRFKAFIKKCKKIAKLRGHYSHSVSSTKVYEDDIILIKMDTENHEMEIEKKKNSNPVMASDKNGRVFRRHGEWIDLEAHVNNLAKTSYDNMNHPIQPVYLAEGGVLRFKPNKIVRFLVDKGGYDLNKLATMDFSAEDWEQLAQLIGYSISGAGDLSYMSDRVWYMAQKRGEKLLKEAAPKGE